MASLKEKEITPVEASNQLKKLEIKIPKSAVGRLEMNTRGGRKPSLIMDDDELERALEDDEFPKQVGIEAVAKRHQPEQLEYIDGDFERHINKLSLSQSVSGCSTRKESLGAACDQTRVSPLAAKNDAKLRREVSTWKVRFEGARSNITIERFLARIEWHAWRSQIQLDGIVGALDLCLEGEALDWFWTTVDRNPDSTWDSIKQEMLVRFETSRTDDDVRRLLNNRIQQFPQESFQEFYQAIQRLTLQSNNTMSDNAIYTILRRNMRPGLQMALHDQRVFRSLSEFVRRCSSLEDMWRRLGHNPEAGLSKPSNAQNLGGSVRLLSRPHVQFDRRPPRVHELTYPDADFVGVDDQAEAEDDSEFYNQVCSINQQLKVRSQQPRVNIEITGVQKNGRR